MRARSFLTLSIAPALFSIAAACSSSDSSPGAPGGGLTDTVDSGSHDDAHVAQNPGDNEDSGNGKIDAGDSSIPQEGGNVDAGPTQTEVEPNGGPSAVGSMVIPGTMNGAIDPANDTDLFTINLTPGDYWEWTATPTGADLAPHVTIFDSAGGDNPTRIGFAAAGSPTKVQHFVFNTGSFVVGMRDERNVGVANGTKGGPTFGYALSAKKMTPASTTITFPTKKTGTLAGIGALDFYTFTGTGGKGFDIIVNAARKAAPSTLDSRLSLYDLTANKWLITNDNVAASTDSQIGSDDPFPSTYLVILENEGTNATDLSYEIQFNLRP